MILAVKEQNGKDRIFSPSEIKDAILAAGIFSKITTNKKEVFYNEPLAFDIETTSIKSNRLDSKIGFMYIWTLSIKGIIVQGRTWEEFVEVMNYMADWYKTNENTLIIYVHNLAYEFQFMHKWLNFTEVFSMKERQPITAKTANGIEFRCSLKLSGYKLEKLGKNLTKYKVEKLVGDLDYSKIRNSKTKLTEKELDYCINDVKVVTSYIQEYIERVGNITLIPKTKTGEVRNYVRNQCFTMGVRKRKTIIHGRSIVV